MYGHSGAMAQPPDRGFYLFYCFRSLVVFQGIGLVALHHHHLLLKGEP